MHKFTRNILRPIYKFLNAPRFRYSLLMEGMRRFFTYESRETIMRMIMEWAYFRNLNGDYMEFGVYKGDSFIKAFHFSNFAGLFSMKFYAFDTFSGYPKIEGIDKECGYFKESDYICDLDTFKKNLSKGGVDLKRTVMVPAPFDKLYEKKIESKIASVVWIDCDLYKSTLQALDFAVDYIADGTVIVFADWFTCNGALDMGQPRAAKEWLEKNPKIKLVEIFNFDGSKTFIVSKPKQII